MCTAATYKTKDFYFGRTLDYEFSYGEEVVITPRNEPFPFRYMAEMPHHFAVIGMACVAQEYPLYYDAVNEKGPVSYTHLDVYKRQRLISPKSPHRRGGLAPRCRLIASWGCIRSQGLSLIHI